MLDGWLEARDEPSWVGPWIEHHPSQAMVDLDVEIALPRADTRTYEYSKLYVASDPDVGFSEASVVCFRLARRTGAQRIRLALPAPVGAAEWIRLRLDPFPFCESGRFRVVSARLVARNDPDRAATARAELVELKQWVRGQVVEAEQAHARECRHLPESLTIELTPGCNLACGHCSSHGTPELHRRNNEQPGLDPDVLHRLVEEVFPSLTAVTLVGRGEPLLADDATWQVLVDGLRRYDVLMRFVTNGTLLTERLTPEIIPLLDMVTVSIDGNSEETMHANRGVRLSRVLEGVRHYHELRRASDVARRPRLGLSWTIKRNNIHELPDFIERMAEFEPDNFYSRHLLVFFEKDEDQSLVGEAELVNRFLRPAYAALRRLGIRSDCPPLMAAPVESRVKARVEARVGAPAEAAPSHNGGGRPAVTRERDRCPFVHRTAVVSSNGNVPMCANMFAPIAGTLADAQSFRAIWNGPVLTEVRGAMDTPKEWNACRSCWFREVQYASQRDAAAQQERFDLELPGEATKAAWDFRRQRK